MELIVELSERADSFTALRLEIQTGVASKHLKLRHTENDERCTHELLHHQAGWLHSIDSEGP